MNTQTTPTKNSVSRLTGSLIGGIFLVLLGLFALVEPYLKLDLGLYLLPALGIIFLAAALLKRSSGLLIPGGILLGIGSGVLLTEGPLASLSEDQNAGIILMAFAGGWLLISLLSMVVEGSARRMMWWPLIPAVILAIVGASLLQGGFFTTLVNIFTIAGPLALIAGGVYLIFRSRRSH